MTLLPLVAVTIGGGIVAWLVRGGGHLGTAIAIGALVATALLAGLLPEPSPPMLAGEPVLLHGYTRLFLVVGCATAVLLALLALTLVEARQRVGALGDDAVTPDMRHAHAGSDASAPAAFLLFLGTAVLTLTIVSPVTALLPAAAGGLAAVLAVPRRPSAFRSAADDGEFVESVRETRRVGLDVLRVTIALAAAVSALELLVGPGDVIAGGPLGVGVAFLALALGAALRLGSLPFHSHAIRLLEGRDRLALPLLTLWGPALFAMAALAAVEAGVLPLELPLSVERGLVAGLAVISITAGIVGALVQDDIDHVVAWSVVGDAAFLLFAFASPDTDAWGPARTWLLVLATSRTALLAWALAAGRTFGTRSLLDLRGWARRAPMLAGSLAIVAVASVGVPGLASFDARLALTGGAFDDPIRTVVFVGSLASVVVIARIFAIGLAQPGGLVTIAPDERFRRPPPDLRRRTGATARQTLDLNRAPLSALLVLALALVALSAGAGLFGLRSLASADVPAALPGSQPSTGAGPSFQPVPTEAVPPTATSEPTAGPTGAPSDGPTPQPSRTPARSSTPRPTR